MAECAPFTVRPSSNCNTSGQSPLTRCTPASSLCFPCQHLLLARASYLLEHKLGWRSLRALLYPHHGRPPRWCGVWWLSDQDPMAMIQVWLGINIVNQPCLFCMPRQSTRATSPVNNNHSLVNMQKCHLFNVAPAILCNKSISFWVMPFLAALLAPIIYDDFNFGP